MCHVCICFVTFTITVFIFSIQSWTVPLSVLVSVLVFSLVSRSIWIGLGLIWVIIITIITNDTWHANEHANLFFFHFICVFVFRGPKKKKNEKYFHFSVKKFTNDNKSWLANDQYTRNHNQCNDFKKKNLFYIIIHIGQNHNNLGTTYAKKKHKYHSPTLHLYMMMIIKIRLKISNQFLSIFIFFFFGYNWR